MRKSSSLQFKVGLFVLVGTGLIMGSILVLGNMQDMFSKKVIFTSRFPDVEGLMPGAKVILGGVPVGTVEDIHFDFKDHKVRVHFSVRQNAVEWLREGAKVEISTQGVLGDKFILIHSGDPSNPPLSLDAEMPQQAGRDIGQFLSKGDELVATATQLIKTIHNVVEDFDRDNRSDRFFKSMVDAAKQFSEVSSKINRQIDSKDLQDTIRSLKNIVSKIERGEGSLGAIINDPSLYDDLKSITGGANRNRVLRNLIRDTGRSNNR